MTMRNPQGPSMRLNWENICFNVREYVEKCADCIQSQAIKRVKVSQPIIPKGPFYRFTADLYQIPDNMLKAGRTDYHYILSCVDYFSNGADLQKRSCYCCKKVGTIFQFQSSFSKLPDGQWKRI